MQCKMDFLISFMIKIVFPFNATKPILNFQLEESIKEVELAAVKSEPVMIPIDENKSANPNPLAPIPERVEDEEIEVESSKMVSFNLQTFVKVILDGKLNLI